MLVLCATIEEKGKEVLWVESILNFPVGGIIFCGILWLSLFSGGIRKVSLTNYSRAFGGKIAMFLDSKLMFLGVLHHELSHALLVVLTGGRLKKVCLFKLNTKDGRLGYVEYVGRGSKLYRLVQKGLVSIAPTLLGTLSLLGLFHLLNQNFTYLDWEFYGILLLICHIACHIAMSPQDWKLSLPALPFLFLLCAFLAEQFHLTQEGTLEILFEITFILACTALPPLFFGIILGGIRR